MTTKTKKKIALRLRKKKAREITVESLATKHGMKRGWLVRKYKIPGARFGLDRIFMKQGRVFLIEFKKLKKKPSPGQVREIATLDKYGVPNYWTDNIEEAISIIDAEDSML